MTEEEAKTKWCPFTRFYGLGQDHFNNREDFERSTRTSTCLGSACMAWRGVGDKMFRDCATGRLSGRDLTGNGDWVHANGYCGLAGAPQ